MNDMIVHMAATVGDTIKNNPHAFACLVSAMIGFFVGRRW